MADEAVADQIDDLRGGPVGNFPEDDPAPTPEPAPTAPEPAPVVEPVAAPTPAAAGSPELETMRAQLDALRQQNEFFQRELHFQRATQQQATQPQPPADPFAEAAERLNVTEQDWNEMLANPRQGAQWATQALRTTLALAVGIAEQRLLGMYQQDQQRRDQERAVSAQGEQMRSQFFADNADLEPYMPIVQHFAGQVAQEQAAAQQRGYGVRDWNQAAQEVAQRTRQYLQQNFNIQPAGPAVAPMRRNALRPAMAEMGGRSGGGRGVATSVGKQIADLMQ